MYFEGVLTLHHKGTLRPENSYNARRVLYLSQGCDRNARFFITP